jgi:hypothetical protein
MSLDFSYKKYKEILTAIHESGYDVVSIERYINNKDSLPEKHVIIRHDVDLDANYQLKFAELENSFGFSTSYYFRHIEGIFDKDVISKVQSLGHEVGYHYEVFTKAKGDIKKAMELFRTEQTEFNQNWGSETVCPHGGSFVATESGYSLKEIFKIIPKLLKGNSVFSKHVNFEMWKEYTFQDFGIIGDAYESVDFSDYLYLSDTGRSFKEKYKRLDKVDSNVNPKFNIKSSNDIIDVIQSSKASKIYLLVHFEQWKDNFFDWIAWYLAQVVRRNGKRIIFKMQKK